jgi:hypothetical protein
MRVTTASADAPAGEPTTTPCLVSVVIPYLNEAENIERCELALNTLALHTLPG